MTLARSAVHEIFLAHAGADRAAAESLFDLLAPDVRAWLDTRCLLLGDEWPVEIPRAQRAALATVILVSSRAEHAYYLRDEIHTAIALHRSFPGEHRVVAVFLDGRPADPMQVPYGLRALHSLDAIAEGGLAAVAGKLKDLVAALRSRSAPSGVQRQTTPAVPSPAAPAAVPLPAPPPAVPLPALPLPSLMPSAPIDRAALYERLCKLTLGGQLDAVILYAGLPRRHIRPELAPLAQRALDVVHLAEEGGPALLARVAEAVAREAPWLLT